VKTSPPLLSSANAAVSCRCFLGLLTVLLKLAVEGLGEDVTNLHLS